MEGGFEEGFPNIDLSETTLADLARATYYENMAKTLLSFCLKALKRLSHTQWARAEKKPFKTIVDEIAEELKSWPDVAPYFEQIQHKHDGWRDQRNFIVHSNWGKNSIGKTAGYCYRREQLGDENYITAAVNHCLWLAKESRNFGYQMALLIASGSLPEGNDGVGLTMKTPLKSVHF